MNIDDSEVDNMSFSSSLELEDSSCEYEYDYDDEEQEEEEEEGETIASDDEGAVIVDLSATANQQVEIIFPVQQEGLPPPGASPARAAVRQQSEVSTATTSSSFVNITNGISDQQQLEHVNSTTTTSSWSHIDSVSPVQSMSTMRSVYSYNSAATATASVRSTARSVISAFELITIADGSVHARCKACHFMNQKHEKVGLCRGCGAVLVNNPCLEMDEQIALSLQQREEKDALETIRREEKRRRTLASTETPPFIRAQALAADIAAYVSNNTTLNSSCSNSMITRGGNLTTSCTPFGIDQEGFACHAMKEMDLTFHASKFIDCFDRLRASGYRLELGYAFSLKNEVDEICKEGLPTNRCRLLVSTDPEVALRIKNGLVPIPYKEEKEKKEKKKTKTTKQGEKEDSKEASSSSSTVDEVAMPWRQYNEGVCVGWIVAVVTSLDHYGWYTVERRNFLLEKPQKIEVLNAGISENCQCLPLAYFDAKDRKDARISSLLQGLSEVCFDFFYTDWSLITIDEEEDDDGEGDLDDNDNVGKAAATSGESSSDVGMLDDNNIDVTNKMETSIMESVPAGYLSSDDDEDDTDVDDDDDDDDDDEDDDYGKTTRMPAVK